MRKNAFIIINHRLPRLDGALSRATSVAEDIIIFLAWMALRRDNTKIIIIIVIIIILIITRSRG